MLNKHGLLAHRIPEKAAEEGAEGYRGEETRESQVYFFHFTMGVK
jgi:hypothetical protein